MELAVDRRRRGQVGQGGRDRRAGRGARLRLDLGLRPLPQRAPARRTRRCSSAGRRWPRSASARAASASARWSAATRTASRALLAKITSTIDVISRRPPRLGHRRRLVRARVPGLRLRVPRRPRTASACCARRVEIVKAMWTEPETTYEGRYYTLSTARKCDPKPLQQPAPADLDRRRRRAAHAAGRRPPRRLLELRRQARRVRPQVRGAEGPLRRRRARLRRDPQDLVARGVHPRDRGRGRGRRHPQSFWGEPVESWTAGNLVGTPEQVAEKIQTYVDLGCTGFVPWCADYPDTETLDAASPRRSIPQFR